MEKLWKNCSKEEKNEVDAIERKFNFYKRIYNQGLINWQEYKEMKDELIEKLDKVKEKYDRKAKSNR